VAAVLAPPAWAWCTRRLVVERLRIGVPGLVAPVRLAHITDLHLSCEGDWPLNASEDFVRHALDLCARENPDLLLFTGDLVSADNARLDDYRRAAALLAEARPPAGVYASLGNHETWYDPDAILDIYADHGITVLDDAWATVVTNAQELQLAGLRYMDGAYDATDLLANAPAQRPHLLLAHDPAAVLDLPDRSEFDVILTGHTHGGQVWLPLVGAPWTPSRAYPDHYRGLRFLDGGCRLFVNRGVGTWLVPIRLWSRPEVAIVDLVPTARGAAP